MCCQKGFDDYAMQTEMILLSCFMLQNRYQKCGPIICKSLLIEPFSIKQSK